MKNILKGNSCKCHVKTGKTNSVISCNLVILSKTILKLHPPLFAPLKAEEVEGTET